jgi:hypothetical protein
MRLLWLGLVLVCTVASAQIGPVPGLGPIILGGISQGFQNLISISLTTNAATQGGIMRREIITSAVLNPISDGHVRVTFTPPTTGNNTTYSAVWIGEASGTGVNYNGGQVQLKFGGSSSVTLTAGGSTVTSDSTSFTYTSGTSIVVCFDPGATSDVRYVSGLSSVNYSDYTKSGTGECPNTTVSGYSSSSGQTAVLSLIEVGP